MEETTSVPSSIDRDDFQIPVRTYSPCGAASPRAAALLVHGGAFRDKDRDSHATIARRLAGLGLVVATASFRNGEEAPHRTGIALRDLLDVIDYVRARWRVPFGLVGSSSGGFFALALSQTLGPSVVAFCVPICPVAHPAKRAAYLRACIAGDVHADGFPAARHVPATAARILEKQLSFWEDEDAMATAGRALASGAHGVPTLLIRGAVDKNVPALVTADVEAWATRTIVMGGRGHELCEEIIDERGYQCFLPDIDQFLDHHLPMKDVEGTKQTFES